MLTRGEYGKLERETESYTLGEYDKGKTSYNGIIRGAETFSN